MHKANGLKQKAWIGLMALGMWPVSACQEEITANLDGDLIPIEAVTVEVSLPFEDFAGGLEAWGGYGRAYELPRDIVAKGFQGSLDSRVLNSWVPYPVFSTVRDSLGVFRADSALTFVGGRIVARFDTLTSVREGPVTLSIGALQRDWDFRSVAWDVAVDSVGDRQLWTEAGGGPVTPLGTAVWDPSAGDTAVFELDSAGVALWTDTARAAMGVRLESETDGTRLDLTNLSLFLTTRPSVNLDTLVELAVGARARTFVYQPVPEVPEGEIRVGGVPAWRTVLTMALPSTLDGIPGLCQVVQCPLTLTPESLISASLVLTTKSPPAAFQPRDSLRMDVRPVLEPSRLPKSPLGSSLVGLFGIQLTPEAFAEEAGTEVEIPLGPYIETLIAKNSGEDVEVPTTLALLSSFEPLSLYFAAFEGPDSPNRPELRLILTLSDGVRIR